MFEHSFRQYPFEFEHFLFYMSSGLLKFWIGASLIHSPEFSEELVVCFEKSFEELSSFCLGHSFYFFCNIIIDDVLNLYLVVRRNALEDGSEDFMILQIGKIRDISPFLFYVGYDASDLIYFVLIHTLLCDKIIKCSSAKMLNILFLPLKKIFSFRFRLDNE